MKNKIRLTEAELTTLIKKVIAEQGALSYVNNVNKPISFDTLYEYMYNEFSKKNNKNISVNLTFDGTQVIANMNGAKVPVTMK